MIGPNFTITIGEKSSNLIILAGTYVYYFGNGWTLPGAIIIRDNGASFLSEEEIWSVTLRENETIHFGSSVVRNSFAEKKGLTIRKH